MSSSIRIRDVHDTYLGSTSIFDLKSALKYMSGSTPDSIHPAIDEQMSANESEKVLAFSERGEKPGAKEALSKVECMGEPSNVTCKFNNLYWEGKQLFVYVLEGIEIPKAMHGLRLLHRWSYDHVVGVREFGNEDAFLKFLSQQGKVETVEGLTLVYDTIWHQNIGHFLWDGLYPAYVSLVQWGQQDVKYNSLVGFMQGTEDGNCMSESIMRRFGMGKFMSRPEIESKSHALTRFEEAILGSGKKGARTVNRDLSLPAGRELNATSQFRDRMYRTHGLAPPPRRQTSGQERAPSESLSAIIIDNKRYEKKEKDMLMNLTSGGGPLGLKVDYIDYAKLPLNFTKHLSVVRDADIMFTAPGTGMAYVPFMHDASIIIATGQLLKKEETFWGEPPGMSRPFAGFEVIFMEEYWYEGSPYLKVLFYNMHERQQGLRLPATRALLDQAATLIRQKFEIPVPPGENLSPVGQTFKTYCYDNATLCNNMLAAIGGSDCAQLYTTLQDCAICWGSWPEAMVYESGYWSLDSDQKDKCPIDHHLMQTVRSRFMPNVEG